MWKLVPLEVAFQNCPETYSCLQVLPSAREDSDCDNLVPSSKEQVGLILQIRDQKSSSYHPKQAETCQRCAMTALQGHWTVLNAGSIHVTFSGIFHLGEMPGEANQLLLPQLVQRVAETQPEWMRMSPVLCEWRRIWAPAISDRSGQDARSREVSDVLDFFKVTSVAGQDLTYALDEQSLDKQSLSRGIIFSSEYSAVSLCNRLGIKDFQGEIVKTF